MDEFLKADFLSDEEANQLFSMGSIPEEDEENIDDNDSQETVDSTIDEDEDSQESVDSGEDLLEDEDTTEKAGSPNTSSIAEAFKEIGVLQTLDDEKIKSIKTAEELADAFEEEVQNRLSEHNKRIDEALKYRVPIPQIQQYENTISTLNSITEEALEDEANENLRKNLIFQDLINKGHSEEDALDLVNDYIENGKDVIKAKKALDSCKNFYEKSYENLKQEYKTKHLNTQKQIKEQSEQLRKSIIEDKELFADLDINKATRQKIYDAVAKPIETLEDGTKITAFQKYLKDNPTDFYKKVGMFFVLTDGFTNIDNLIKGPVKKELKKGISKLESVLNSTSRNADGSFSLKTGVSSKRSILDLDNFKLG